MRGHVDHGIRAEGEVVREDKRDMKERKDVGMDF
jgi:hypothetical protein